MAILNSNKFRVREGSTVDLRRWPTRIDPVYRDEADYERILKEHIKEMQAQQEMLYASSSYAVLLIFQAMDAAGKDGVITHVMSGVNPQGCDVHQLQAPERDGAQARLSVAHGSVPARSAGKSAFSTAPTTRRC